MISVIAIGVRRLEGPGASIWFWEYALETMNTKVKIRPASGKKDWMNLDLIWTSQNGIEFARNMQRIISRHQILNLAV
jgi:hypothetical protein